MPFSFVLETPKPCRRTPAVSWKPTVQSCANMSLYRLTEWAWAVQHSRTSAWYQLQAASKEQCPRELAAVVSLQSKDICYALQSKVHKEEKNWMSSTLLSSPVAGCCQRPTLASLVDSCEGILSGRGWWRSTTGLMQNPNVISVCGKSKRIQKLQERKLQIKKPA